MAGEIVTEIRVEFHSFTMQSGSPFVEGIVNGQVSKSLFLVGRTSSVSFNGRKTVSIFHGLPLNCAVF